jgi:hypothetical protein
MLTHTKLRVFLPVMLVGFLFFGAAAEARQNRDDRVATGAVIGAAVGTLLQLVQGHSDGRQVLTGAVVGGALGAAAGAVTDNHGRYYRRDGSYGYRGQEYYPSQGYYQGGYEDPYYGYGTQGYYPAPRVDGRYDYDSRYDSRARRQGSRCRHR